MLLDQLRLFFFRVWVKRRIRAAWEAIPDGRRLLRFHTRSGREIVVVFNKNTRTPCCQIYVEGIGPSMPPTFHLLECVDL